MSGMIEGELSSLTLTVLLLLERTLAKSGSFRSGSGSLVRGTEDSFKLKNHQFNQLYKSASI